uniref:Putative secreted protein n=1 Tax=Anopheles triannulatus TaxID=58253 RepID=A0A2M4B0U4_9DIPT
MLTALVRWIVVVVVIGTGSTGTRSGRTVRSAIFPSRRQLKMPLVTLFQLERTIGRSRIAVDDQRFIDDTQRAGGFVRKHPLKRRMCLNAERCRALLG